MSLVMRVSDHVNVSSFGRNIASGPPAQVRADPAVIEAYLGVQELISRGEGATGSALLSLENVEAPLRPRAGPAPHLARGAGGVDRGSARRERSGEDDHAARGLGHGPPVGWIIFAGKPLRGGPEAVARAGIAHVPEGRGTFTELTVTENLRLGAYTRRERNVRSDIDRVSRWFPWIRDRAQQPAGTLSGGEQQMLAAGARADGAPAPPDARRAVTRSRSDDRPRDLPDRAGAERAGGPHGARRRAGRADRAPGGGEARTCSRSAAWQSPGRARSSGRTSRVRRSYLGY